MTAKSNESDRRFASEHEREMQEHLSKRAKEIGASAALAENSMPCENGDMAYRVSEDEVMFVQSLANAAWWRNKEIGGGALARQARNQARTKEKNIEALRKAWEQVGRPHWTARQAVANVPELAHLDRRTVQRYLAAIRAK